MVTAQRNGAGAASKGDATMYDENGSTRQLVEAAVTGAPGSNSTPQLAAAALRGGAGMAGRTVATTQQQHSLRAELGRGGSSSSNGRILCHARKALAAAVSNGAAPELW